MADLVHLTWFDYDSRNRLAWVTLADNTDKHLEYDLRGNKIRETDENGHSTSFTYDALNRLTRVTKNNGSGQSIVAQTSYNAVGSKTSVTDPNGNAATMEYDTIQRLTKTTTPAGITTYEYGANSGGSAFDSSGFKPTKATDPRGYITSVTYDALYRPVSSSAEYKMGTFATTSSVYDKVGNLTSVTDPLLKITATQFDALNRPVKVTHADGKFVTTAYTSAGLNWKATDELGRETETEYDKAGRAIKVTGPALTGGLRPESRTLYDNAGNIIAIINPLGKQWDYTFDNRNRKVSETAPAVYDAESEIEQRPISRWAYDAVGNIIGVTDPKGNRADTSYDAVNRPVQLQAPAVIDPREYDTIQRLTKTTTPAGISTYEYGANSGGSAFDSSGFKPTKAIDPRGYITSVTYDALYRPVSSFAEYKTGTFATTSSVYDKVGNLTSVTDPLLKATATQFDALNRPVKVTHADGKFVTTAYSSAGLNWKATDELGRETETEYDKAGRAIKVTGPALTGGLRPESRTLYDNAGNIIAIINPLGKQWDYTFDNRNRKVSETAPAVYDAESEIEQRPISRWAYDAVGNVIGVTDPKGNRADTSYDAVNRPVQLQAPAVIDPSDATLKRPTTATTYDANGNVLTVTDPNGHVTTNVYDALNRLTSTTDAASITVSYEYDAAGNRTKVTDGKNQSTQFEYDGLNRNTRTTNVASQSTTFVYNAVNKTSRTDANGQTTSYTYDDRHRLKTVTYSIDSSGNQTYSYDDAGHLLTVVEPGKGGKANVAYTYDALNRVVSETSGGLTHQYEYDLAGNRLKTTYGGSGLEIVSTYDSHNRLSTMTEGGRTTTYRYDLNGKVREKELPGDTLTETAYDALGRIQTIVETVSGNDLSQTHQEYDLGGNVKTVEEQYSSGSLSNRTVSNTYDSANRLIEESIDLGSNGTADITTSYVYDAGNNRTQKTVVGGTNAGVTNYTINNLDQVVGLNAPGGNITYTYDTNGSRKTRTKGAQTDTYTYDAENRLTGLVKAVPDAGLTTGTFAYTYDYRTRRVERDESGAGGNTTKIVFAGGLSCFEEESGARTVEYIRGSDYGGGVGGILYTLRSSTPSYNHYNNRGDVVAKTDGTGILTCQAQYEAFGNRLQESGGTPDRQKMNTKEEDPTGLVNHGFRYFDLETEGWLTRDPAGFVDGPNLYAYVRQNPWSKFDPIGLAGYFFDGTGNDKDDKNLAKTHIAALHSAYKGRAFYENGVGTRSDVALGNAFGKGASARIAKMMSNLERQLLKGDTNIDIFGFSRGAAMAREFANQIHDKHPELRIRFMGIFDTVAQVGLPNPLNVNSGIRLAIPDAVNFTAHAIAQNEYRSLFPLTSITKGYGGLGPFPNHGFNKTYSNREYREVSGSRFIEKPFAGAHSDVGGGYSDGGNRGALKWMMQQAQRQGVPVSWSQMPKSEKPFFNTYPTHWHESRRAITGAPDLFGAGIDNRVIFSGNLN